MPHWKLLPKDTDKVLWNNQLKQFENYNLYQTFGWGEYKKLAGWIPHRFMATGPDNTVVCMAQGLLKKYFPGVGVLWFPGGPLGELDHLNADFVRFLKEITEQSTLYIRIGPYLEDTSEQASRLAALNWRRCQIKLWSGISLYINPSLPAKILNDGLTKNWRHNLKRSANSDLEITRWEHPDLDQVLSIYHDMEKKKGIPPFFNKQSIEHLYHCFENHMIVVKCSLRSSGKLLGIRACATIHQHALDLWASVNDEGRKVYASYALFWALLEECRKESISHYNLGGVDPQQNTGVYNFKKGTGAAQINFLGEWDKSTSYVLKKLMDIKIKRMARGF
ncbi:MAG: peptidoglycan bridge formation glycyltransferase FemA/FemB family protein [Deltaproteobacteria bacterium]|nr:peptidoglycan bridge formation glycyltransferase FemA/FemB family protein [Deltaproteobacteria bacterium]